MSAIKCPNPACGGTEGYVVRPVYEWHRGFRWRAFWRGVCLYRVQVGDCVVCCRCDTPMVHADSESFLTQRALEKLGVPRYRPAGGPPEDNGMRRDLVRAVTLDP